MVSTRIRAPTSPAIQQARQAAAAVRDGEESNYNIDDEVECEGGYRFAETEAAEIVC